jgi:hypothetical protein
LELYLLDSERAAKVAGSKFYYLKNELVLLEMAVMRFALDVLRSKGFTVMTVPNLVRTEALYGMGEFAAPEDEEDGNVYKLAQDELYLAGTAEAGLVNYRSEEILAEAELPQRYAGISACYRREAGTYGKETRGLYRVHQFNKVEMVSLVHPDGSPAEHERLLDIAEDLLQKLGLHYQVVLNCGGDLGTPQSKKWDIETWMPGMGKYGETHSCSNDTDYQSRNLNIRYRATEGKELGFVHTLNDGQYADLLRLTYLGNQVANAGRPDDQRIAGFDDVEQQLLAMAKAAGLANYADFDRPKTRYFAGPGLEAELGELLMDYEDAVFWDELARRLALQELESQMGRVAIEALADSEYTRLEDPLFEKYWQEFQEHGVERLTIQRD